MTVSGLVSMADEQEFVCLLNSQFELLTKPENSVKQRGLIELHKCFEIVINKQLRLSVIQEELTVDIVSSLVDTFRGSSESCRETIINILQLFVTNSIFSSDLDRVLVPLIDKCFGSGDLTSEEIRYQLVHLLKEYLDRRSLAELETDIEAVGRILHNSFLDPYSEVKKEACFCIQSMKGEILRSLIEKCSSDLVKSLEVLFTYQQFRVRTACVDCINVMVLNADIEFLQVVFQKLAQISMDPVPQVRLCLTKVVGNWMVNLSYRHYVWDRLISLFLPSLSDDIEDVRNLALEVWINCGKQYANDVERDISVGMLQLNINHCPFMKSELQELPLGCRAIVSSHCAKLLPAIQNDFRDWMDPVKLKASQLLYQLVANAKEDIAPQTLKLIDVLLEGCKIEEKDVFNTVVESAKITGYFVKSDVWCPVILLLLEDIPTLSCLQVLENFLIGCHSLDKTSEANILKLLIEPNICHTLGLDMKVTILSCIERLLELTNSRDEQFFNIFYIAAVIHGTTESLQARVNLLMENVAVLLGNDSTRYVWNLYGKLLIEELESITPCVMWNEISVEWKVFSSLLKESESILLSDDANRIIAVISAPDKDDVMKFNCLKALGYLFENGDCSKISDSYIISCLNGVIIPNMIWRSGSTAACVRAAAVASLYLLLKFCKKPELEEVLLGNLILHLVNNCEDDVSICRQMVCRTFSIIIDNYSHHFNGERFSSIISLMLRRMEDVVQDVRITACENVGKSFNYWFATGSYEFDGRFKKCFETSMKRLLLYFYDADIKLQEAAVDAVRKLTKWDVNSVKHYVSEVFTTSNSETENLMNWLKHLQ